MIKLKKSKTNTSQAFKEINIALDQEGSRNIEGWSTACWVLMQMPVGDGMFIIPGNKSAPRSGHGTLLSYFAGFLLVVFFDSSSSPPPLSVGLIQNLNPQSYLVSPLHSAMANYHRLKLPDHITFIIKCLKCTSKDMAEQLWGQWSSRGDMKSGGPPAVWNEADNDPRIRREDKF